MMFSSSARLDDPRRSWRIFQWVEDLWYSFPRCLKNKGGCDNRGIQFFGRFTKSFSLNWSRLLTRRVPQKDVREGDELKGLAEAHGVSEDAAEAVGRLEPRRRLDDVVVQKTDATDLGKNRQSWLKNWVLLNKTYPTDIKTINVIKTSKPNLTYPYFVSSLDPRSCRRGQKVAAEMAGVS